jgi:hypothetical protein
LRYNKDMKARSSMTKENLNEFLIIMEFKNKVNERIKELINKNKEGLDDMSFEDKIEANTRLTAMFEVSIAFNNVYGEELDRLGVGV